MLFDNFGPGQMGNGQGPPSPQQAQGSPNFQLGNWGNVPQGGGGQPNFAAMLQQFLQRIGQRPQGGQNLMGGMGGGAPPNVQPGGPGGGAFASPGQTGQMPGNTMRPVMPGSGPNASQMTPFLGR